VNLLICKVIFLVILQSIILLYFVVSCNCFSFIYQKNESSYKFTLAIDVPLKHIVFHLIWLPH